jgi:hypothetical protein
MTRSTREVAKATRHNSTLPPFSKSGRKLQMKQGMKFLAWIKTPKSSAIVT